jgi:chemotaxis protein MotB
MSDYQVSRDEELEFGDEHEEELWIMSYADMVTLLFGFFVILYSFSNLDEKKFEQLSKDMAKTFQSESKQDELKAEDGDIESQLKAFKLLVTMLNIADNPKDAVKKMEALAEQKNASQVAKDLLEEATKSDNKTIQDLMALSQSPDILTEIILPEMSLFKPGRPDLISGSEQKIHRLAMDITSVPNVHEIEVVGHTDTAPLAKSSPFGDNFALSSMRAGSVARLLVKYGIPDKLISVKGMGGLHPIVPDRDKNGRYIPENMSKNRRVHIVLRKRMNANGR